MNSALVSLPTISTHASALLCMSTMDICIKNVDVSINYMRNGCIRSKGTSLRICQRTSSSGLLSETSFTVASPQLQQAVLPIVSIHYQDELLLEVKHGQDKHETVGKIVNCPIEVYTLSSSTSRECDQGGLMQMCCVTNISCIQLYIRYVCRNI